MQRPAPGDHDPSFQAYIDLVPDGDLIEHLDEQGRRTKLLVSTVDEAHGAHRYAPGKWTVKQVLQHVTDGERLFCYRAMCIARGDTTPLPAFDEVAYAANDGSDSRRLVDIADELACVRAATLALFRGFDAAAWQRRGTANGKPASVRSLAWSVAGHELHHVAVLRERYGLG